MRTLPAAALFPGGSPPRLCIAGGICLQLLRRRGITVISRIAAIGGVTDTAPLTASTAEKPFPVVEDAAGEAIRAAIAAAKAEGDSVGGIIECAVLGLPWDWAAPCSTEWREKLPPLYSESPP